MNKLISTTAMISIWQVIQLWDAMWGSEEVGIDGNADVITRKNSPAVVTTLMGMFEPADLDDVYPAWCRRQAQSARDGDRSHTSKRQPTLLKMARIFETLASVCRAHILATESPEEGMDYPEGQPCGQNYTHHSGNYYRITNWAFFESTGEPWVIYKALEGNTEKQHLRPWWEFQQSFTEGINKRDKET